MFHCLPYLDGAITGYSSIYFEIGRFILVSEPNNGVLLYPVQSSMEEFSLKLDVPAD